VGNKYLTAFIETSRPLPQIKANIANILRAVGGTIYSTPAGFQINDGTYGTQMSITARLVAQIAIHPVKENRYEIQVWLNWTWSTLMWIVLILGVIGGGLPWLMLILYLFFDPAPAYQQALYRIANYESMQ
jgi:hypothetical protein